MIYPTLLYKETRVSPKVRVLPSGTLSQTLDSENFFTASWSLEDVLNRAHRRMEARGLLIAPAIQLTCHLCVDMDMSCMALHSLCAFH